MELILLKLLNLQIGGWNFWRSNDYGHNVKH